MKENRRGESQTLAPNYRADGLNGDEKIFDIALGTGLLVPNAMTNTVY